MSHPSHNEESGRAHTLGGSAKAPRADALQAALQAMSDGVVLFDQGGRVVFVNDAEVAMCGYDSREEMLGDVERFARVFELFHLDGRPLPVEEWPVTRVLRREQLAGVELRGRRKDTGQERLFCFSGRLLEGDDGAPFALLVTRDLTESRGALDALRKSEARFRDLADAMPQLVWTADHEATVDYCNSRAAEYAGITQIADRKWQWEPLLHPDDLERTLVAWSAAVAERSPYACEHRVRMADGSFRWHLSRALPVVERDGTPKWYGTATDIHGLKVAEGALRESEAQYRSLFESVDQGFCVIETIFDERDRCVDYRFLEMNRIFEEQTGLSSAAGRTMRELVPGHDRFWFEIYGDVAKTGEPRRFEDYASAMGRWFDVYAFRVGAHELRRVAVLFSNITERRRREQHAAFLQELSVDVSSSSRFDEVMERVASRLCAHLDVSRVAFAEVNEDATSATVVYERASGQAQSALGEHPLSSFMGEDLLQELKAGRAVAVDDVASDPRTAAVASSYVDFGVGAQIHVPHLSAGRLTSLLAIHREGPHAWRPDEVELMQAVAARLWGRLERARAEDALRDQVERSRLLGRATNDVIWDWDLGSDKLEWNDALMEQYGHSPDGLCATQEGWAAHLHPNDRERTLASLHAAIHGAEESWTEEYRFQRADGSYATVLDRGYILRDRAGRAVRLIGSMLDLTERKAAEAALKESARQKDEWLAMLSHELRNPLAPIRNGVYILQRAPGSPQAGRALDVIDRQAVHMTRLIDDLLDVTRLSRGKVRLKRERLELSTLVRRTVEDHRVVFADAGVTLDVDVRGEPLFVDGDPTRLAQALGNLLTNAAKFTARGGRALVHLARADDDRAAICVRDDGAGIGPHLRESLFQPFVQGDATLDRSRGGLGLGLTLAKGFAEMHGGTLCVESAGLGHGAAFTLRLPLAAAEGAAVVIASPEAGKSARTLRVLVIDDQPDVVGSLRDVLELKGHTVAAASAGEAALDTARSFLPDVVLCDIGLPGMDGYAVARCFRGDPAHRETFLVALSGYARAQDVADAHAAGFDTHLAKPPDLARLDALLDDARGRAGA